MHSQTRRRASSTSKAQEGAGYFGNSILPKRVKVIFICTKKRKASRTRHFIGSLLNSRRGGSRGKFWRAIQKQGAHLGIVLPSLEMRTAKKIRSIVFPFYEGFGVLTRSS